jgi:hypothetical protein
MRESAIGGESAIRIARDLRVVFSRLRRSAAAVAGVAAVVTGLLLAGARPPSTVGSAR